MKYSVRGHVSEMNRPNPADGKVWLAIAKDLNFSALGDTAEGAVLEFADQIGGFFKDTVRYDVWVGTTSKANLEFDKSVPVGTFKLDNDPGEQGSATFTVSIEFDPEIAKV